MFTYASPQGKLKVSDFFNKDLLYVIIYIQHHRFLLAVSFSDVVCPLLPAGEIQGGFKETS